MKLTLLIGLLVAGSAAAQDVNRTPPTPAPSSVSAPSAPAETTSSSVLYDGTHWGLQIDAGAPAGATAALVYRPWRFLRLNAGVGWDYIAFGVKGGVTLIPFHWGVVPTLGLEVGHFFDGDVNKVATINDPVAKILTKEIGFNYATADLGLEFGAQNRFVFYIRAGISQIWGPVKNVNSAFQEGNRNNTSGTTYLASDADASARIPSARLGFILYLF